MKTCPLTPQKKQTTQKPELSTTGNTPAPGFSPLAVFTQLNTYSEACHKLGTGDTHRITPPEKDSALKKDTASFLTTPKVTTDTVKNIMVKTRTYKWMTRETP